MSAISGGIWTEGLCPRIQTKLNEIVGSEANPENKRHHVGTLDWLMSDRNRHGFLQNQVDMGDGKGNEGTNRSKVVDTIYYQREDPASFATSFSTGCPTGDQKPLCEASIEISNELESATFKVQEDQMRRICESQDEHVAFWIQQQMRAGAKRLNDLLGTDLGANLGTFQDGAVVKEYQLLNNTEGRIWSFGEAELMRDLKNAHFSGNVAVIGDGNWEIYRSITDIGAVGNTAIQTGRQGRFPVFYDPALFTNAGLDNINHGLVIESGTAQLLTWNGFNGKYRKVHDHYVRDTIMDPETGLVWDIRMDYEECPSGGTVYDSNWNIQILLSWDVFNLPANVYAAGDDLFGVTGIYNVEGTAA